MPKGRLLPFCGQTTDQHADLSTLWLDTEDTNSYKKYLKYYHNPSLPEKYRLDGDWTYEFNSLGYRGENYDPQAKFHIYTYGCSYTYGFGIKQHQTFSHVFKERLASEKKLSPEEVNLLNFSQRGGSNDYIARTIISQCSQVKPDLALVLFTTKERIEHVSGKEQMNIGSWIKNTETDNYFKLYSEEMGMINLLKNMILVQQFFSLNSIPNKLFAYQSFLNLLLGLLKKFLF